MKSDTETKLEYYDLKETGVYVIPKESTEPVTKVYDKEIAAWISEINAMLFAQLDDHRLKEANNDRGLEYYLKVCTKSHGRIPEQRRFKWY